MLTAPPPDLLVVGGLTIDRFADGSSAAGGSILHATRGMHLDGRTTIVVTLAGPEDAARMGLDGLRAIAEVHAQQSDRTIGFEHRETPASRELTITATAGQLHLPAITVHPRAVLYAPIADELDAGLGGQRYEGATSGAILQGWLRDLAPGHPVRSIEPAQLDPALVAQLATLDLLVASVDDLAAIAADPRDQLRAMRRTFGPSPTLVVTAGAEGAWLSADRGDPQHVQAARLIQGVPTVGAGDVFAAAMLAALSRGVPAPDAGSEASHLVAEFLAERSGRQLHVIGDVHGMLDQLTGALRAAGLLDDGGRWSGDRDELWMAGDLTDRGPDGIGVIDLLMRLQAEAAASGGRVGSVLGNHEILLLGAREIPRGPTRGRGATFEGDWLANGGRREDLARLQDRHAAWLRSLPLAARAGSALVVHADATLYLHIGRTVTEANRVVTEMLSHPQPERWDQLLADFTERRGFLADPGNAARLLALWGGREVVHGHTPVPRLFGTPGADAAAAVRYADGRAVAVDGGVYSGGSVIVHRVPGA